MVQLKSLHEPPRYLLGLSTSEPSGTFISRFSGWISMLGRCHMVRMRHPWQMVMAMAHGSSSHIVSKSWTSISSHGLSSFSQHFFSKLNSHFWGKHISLYIYIIMRQNHAKSMSIFGMSSWEVLLLWCSPSIWLDFLSTLGAAGGIWVLLGQKRCPIQRHAPRCCSKWLSFLSVLAEAPGAWGGWAFLGLARVAPGCSR